MSNWSPQDYASVVAAVVSVAGAGYSWWSARRRLRWDAGKELGTFRADTIELARMAFCLDNPTWRRVSMKRFAETQSQWKKDLQRFAPIIGKNAYLYLRQLDNLLDNAKQEALGMPLGGLAAEEAQCDEEFQSNDLSRETSNRLRKWMDRIRSDPLFLSR